MRVWTYEEARNKLERDLDLQGEEFITSTEMLGLFNEAIDEAEAEIHTIYEDYFLTSYLVPLVQGTSEYDLPSNIYAQKIRSLMYHNGPQIYQIRQYRRKDKFEKIALTDEFGQSDDYRYFIKNDSIDAGYKLVLSPASRETSSTVMTMWYIRNAARVALDTDKIDIPEFTNFVIQFVKVRCYEKEGHPNLGAAVQMLTQQRQMMVDTLTNRIDDDDTRVEPDLTHYMEHS